MISFYLLFFCAVAIHFRSVYVLGAICRTAICEYDFVISRAQTMTYVHPSGTVFNVAFNGSRLVVAANSLRSSDAYPEVIGMVVDPAHVITADGYPRDLIVVNNQYPGPTIEVTEGSQVIVRVYNNLLSEVTSIHWHGMRMRNNNLMDGVPYVTQCPILPGQIFTYHFEADPAGTHWYHSHHANQRIDGLYGMLVVQKRYSEPLPFHGIFVTDWFHFSSEALALRSGTLHQTRFTGETLRASSSRYFSFDGIELTSTSYVSSLLGGRGRYDDQMFPLEVYSLVLGQRHIFRVVNAGADFSFEVSADTHLLDIEALDGYDIQPITVDTVMLHPGESIDFTILADQAVSRYWLRAKTLLHGIGSNMTKSVAVQEARAILEYDGFVGERIDPLSEPRLCTTSRRCIVFNCPFQDFPKEFNKTCINIHEVQSRYDTSQLQSEFGLNNASPKELFLNFAFIKGSSVNGRRFVPPRGFGYLEPDEDKYIVPCDEESCKERGCSCTNILSLPSNATIQLVLMNYQPSFDAKNLPSHHSIHLHGHGFAVLAVGFGLRNITNGRVYGTNEDISCNSQICSSPRWTKATPALNLARPPIKDTVLVPAQGYVVIQFRTNNPGQWMIHCHQELHFLKGMAAIIDEGAAVNHSRRPNGFQSCGDFNLTKTSHMDSTKELKITSQKNVEPVTTPCFSRNEDMLLISRTVAACTAMGFLFLGAILALILVTVKHLVEKRNIHKRQPRKQKPHQPKPLEEIPLRSFQQET